MNGKPLVRNLSKATSDTVLPDFAGLQKKSFEQFVQLDTDPADRKEQGLERLLRSVFPAPIEDGKQVAYGGYTVPPPSLHPWECERLARTYSGEIRVKLRLEDETLTEVKAADLPLMTDRGTFIIDGVEKVIIGTLQATEDAYENDLANRLLYMVGHQLTADLRDALEKDIREASQHGETHFHRFSERIHAFFRSGHTARKANRANPLSLVSHMRTMVQTGVKRRPGYGARDVHPSHFGRICILETPEGERIGINLTAAVLADTDGEGRLLTPLRSRDGDSTKLFSAEEQAGCVLGDLASGIEYETRYHGGVLVAADNNTIRRANPSEIGYKPAHPGQALGVSASLIPFLANDDANRALMGANMQKQAVPLVSPEAPIIRTGMESKVAADARAAITADVDGQVNEVSHDAVVIRAKDGAILRYRYHQTVFEEEGISLGHRLLVAEGDSVAAGQVIADGPATQNGVLALGRNVLVGYMCWKGYNFEDGIVVSDRLLRDHVFTSVKTHIFTATIAASSEDVIGIGHLEVNECRNLSPEGLISVGSRVVENDILIGRKSGKGDRSVRMPAGQSGIVVKVERFRSEEGAILDDGLEEVVRVTVADRRELKVGDKLCNRHGAKGVVTLIVPEAEMPVLPDGRPLDVILNPLGVPSRLNIGSILETHLGLAAHSLGCDMVSPGYNGATIRDIEDLLIEAGLPKSGMLKLRDGRTGRQYDQDSTVGYQYLMKLDHMAEDSLQARNTGPYDPHTQQPIGGRRHRGGLRIGIMETWALQGYGAAGILQELMTVKSDDEKGRNLLYDSLTEGKDLPKPTVPASIKRLAAQLLGLCLDLTAFGADGSRIDLSSEEATIEHITAVSLGYADARRIIELSAGKLEPSEDIATLGELFGEDSHPSVKNIELASPVRHSWQDRLQDDERLPLITLLPVLPPSLGGNRLKKEYLSVLSANERCRKGESDPADLQAAVDGLIHGLTRMLYGKNGWITSAISGKRVDYCGRSVVCPGPDLAHDTCSIPLSMAATLLEPVVAGRMVRDGIAESVGDAKGMLQKRDANAIEVLRKEAESRYILLHRAPVLHRMGIQAFRVAVADEPVIRIHPLTMAAFNADFDGDEMDVFLPLSDAAQGEARDRVRSSLSQLGPASGMYVYGPTQDMVFGCHYATSLPKQTGRPKPEYDSLDSVASAMDKQGLGVHDPIKIGKRETTVGRALFNSLLPEDLRWVDEPATKALLARLLKRCHDVLGRETAAKLGDALMRFGFRQATLSGASIGKDTLKRYEGFEAELTKAWQDVERLDGHWSIVDHWTRATDRIAKAALEDMKADQEGMNPVYMMAVSGARGSSDQIRQLIAMRGLMAMPDGRIMQDPITTNFVHGLSPLEHLASVFGARKGLSDTALKTADAGFLYKRIMGAVQDVMLTEEDCGTVEGVTKEGHPDGEHEWFPLHERIAGRTALVDIILPNEDTPIVEAGELITPADSLEIEKAGYRAIEIRSPVTCKSAGGICAACYGLDLSTGEKPKIGLALGVIAAQSIGEPATQLTMRTFHTFIRPPIDPKDRRPRTDILGGLPRLDRLMEAWTGREEDADEYDDLCELYDRAGSGAAAESLLIEMQKVYRVQGVRINDRHFEVVLSRMLAGGSVKGVSEAALMTDDFIVAGSSRNGIDALARLAAANQPVELSAIRNCMAFCKEIPAVGRFQGPK